MLQKINANKLNGAWLHKIGGNGPLLSGCNCTGTKSVMTDSSQLREKVFILERLIICFMVGLTFR